jgi:hypothetical protein
MGETKFSTFIMSETTRNQIKALPKEKQLKFFWAVMNFGLDGIEPDFDGIELAVWIPMRDLILSSKRQDEVWRTKQRENGKKGGRPKKKSSTNDETQNNPKNPAVFDETQKTQGFSDENPKTHNEKENDNVNEKENGKGEKRPFSFSPFIKTSEPEGPDSPDLPPKDYSKIFEEVKSKWKEITGQETREFLLTISPVKREKFINTLANYTLEEIVNAIRNYWFTKNNPEEYDIGNRIYGTLYGFLENGVGQFHSDKMVKANFRRKKDGG